MLWGKTAASNQLCRRWDTGPQPKPQAPFLEIRLKHRKGTFQNSSLPAGSS